jgi:hypothetical protein
MSGNFVGGYLYMVSSATISRSEDIALPGSARAYLAGRRDQRTAQTPMRRVG